MICRTVRNATQCTKKESVHGRGWHSFTRTRKEKNLEVHLLTPVSPSISPSPPVDRDTVQWWMTEYFMEGCGAMPTIFRDPCRICILIRRWKIGRCSYIAFAFSRGILRVEAARFGVGWPRPSIVAQISKEAECMMEVAPVRLYMVLAPELEEGCHEPRPTLTQ